MVPADEDDGLMTSVIRYAPKSNGLDGRKADVLFAECTSGQDYTTAGPAAHHPPTTTSSGHPADRSGSGIQVQPAGLFSTHARTHS